MLGWADVKPSPTQSLEPLPTHSPPSAVGWKPVSHRQLKEPSVLTQCPPRHGSAAAHSSTSRIEIPVGSAAIYGLFRACWSPKQLPLDLKKPTGERGRSLE